MNIRKHAAICCAVCLLVLLLAGCTGDGSAARPYTPDDAQILLDAGLFNGDMSPLEDSDVVALLYGIDGTAIRECVCYMAANTAVSADELTVLVLTDEDAAIAAEAACRARVEHLIDVSKDYTPAAVPRLEAAVIRRVGNTILLAVGDPDRMEKAVNNLH